MPSGTRVRANIVDHYALDVHVFAPSHLRGTIEGLCGNYDGDRTNDLYPKGMDSNSPNDNSSQPRDFSNSYRYWPNSPFVTKHLKQSKNVILKNMS